MEYFFLLRRKISKLRRILITSVIWQGFGRSGSLQLWDLSLQGSPSFWLSLGSREASWPRYFVAIIMGWDKNCDARMELTC